MSQFFEFMGRAGKETHEWWEKFRRELGISEGDRLSYDWIKRELVLKEKK